ncbi:hypothetical protein ACTXT7_010122 [Hymenolepis weldensis]
MHAVMDWSQFLEPQLLLGMGAFTVGVINAYWNHRQHRQGGTGGENNASQTASEHYRNTPKRSESAEVNLIPIEGFIEDDG